MNFEAPKTPAPEAKKTGFKITKKPEVPVAEAPVAEEGVSGVQRLESLSSKPKAETPRAEMALAANESRLTRSAFESNPIGGINNLIRNIDKITPDDAEDLLASLPKIGSTVYDEAFARKSAQLTRMLENRKLTTEQGGLGKKAEETAEAKKEDPALVRVAAINKEFENYSKILEADPDSMFELSSAGKWVGELENMDRKTKASPRTGALINQLQSSVQAALIKAPEGLRKTNLNKLKYRLENMAKESKYSS
jgi:hypothetical protein